MNDFVLMWGFWGCLVAALMFLVRIFVAIFSPKVVEQMRKHPAIHVAWGGVTLTVILFFLLLMNVVRWPPLFVERKAQRAKVAERIQSAGGWAALQKDCNALMAEYHENGFDSLGGSTNPLPLTIAALHPKRVSFIPPAIVSGSKDYPQVPVVRIKVFGGHSTGGHSIPYFGLEVVCSTNAAGYQPRSPQMGVSGNHYDSYRQVTKTIYERF
jgi:hypothetical protein